MDNSYCVAPLSEGWVMACCRTGASHIRGGQPCQDACATWIGQSQGRPFVVLAAADGHGDPRHERSAIGAELAVNCAIQECAEFGFNYRHPRDLASTFRGDFPRRLSTRWREAVEGHAKSEPPSDHQLHGDRELWKLYGTTLTVALVTNEIMLLGQIGDGAAVLVNREGVVEKAFPPAPNAVGPETASLCSQDAEKLWMTRVLSDPARYAMLFLCTDGLPNSFETQQGLEAFFRDFCQLVRQHGLARVAQEVPAWLDKFSSEGSGDDMTLVALLLSLSAVPAKTAPARAEAEQPSPGPIPSDPPNDGDASPC